MKISYPAILDGGLSYPLEKNGLDIKNNLWVSELLISNPKAIKKAQTSDKPTCISCKNIKLNLFLSA